MNPSQGNPSTFQDFLARSPGPEHIDPEMARELLEEMFGISMTG